MTAIGGPSSRIQSSKEATMAVEAGWIFDVDVAGDMVIADIRHAGGLNTRYVFHAVEAATLAHELLTGAIQVWQHQHAAPRSDDKTTMEMNR
jgi:hypothetical protein